ncbi:MAG: VWA domain-containing protein [Candidatus Aminicenantes bacterium]|nr:VWA domain-containing protein [Candidatus Aminicenantes bacterium]
MLKIKKLRRVIPNKKIKVLPLSVVLIFIFTKMINVSYLSSYSQETKNKKISHTIAVSAISIAVTVQNKRGRYINDLTKEDFIIYEKDEKKDITYFNHDFKAPLSLTVLLDVSGSMELQDKLRESKESLKYLVTSLLDLDDEFSLLIFADGEVEVAMNFSNNKNYFLEVLEKTEAYGQTALNDAVAVTPEFANKGNNEKRAILLITDGIENDSQYSHYQAVEIARRVDIPIYTIGYKIPLSDQYLRKYKHSPSLTSSGIVYSLERFSKSTGGKAFFINQAEELKTALGEIKKELGHQYILGYTSYRSPEKEYREIKVVTSKKKYKVRTREGYYSGEKKSP